MSSTNKTTNYNLSQFVGTDVPSYLGDYNGDMAKIDNAISEVANSQGSVEQSVIGLVAEVQGLSSQVSGMGTSVQQVQTSVAQIDSAYKQADTALSQRITTNASNIQTNATAIENSNTAIETINTAIGTENISGIGDGTIKGAISNINNSLNNSQPIETDSYTTQYAIGDTIVVKNGKVVTINFPSLTANIPLNQNVKMFDLDEKYKVSNDLGTLIIRVPDVNNNNEVVAYIITGREVYFYKYGSGNNATTSNCTLTYITD